MAEIDLMDFVRDVWRAKYTLATAIIFAFVFALISLGMARKTYTATTVLGPAENSPQDNSSSSLGRIAGAAGLLGVSLGPAAGGGDFTKFKALLTSKGLAEELYANDALKPILFGPGWVPKTRTWKRPTGLTFEIKNSLKGILGLRQWSPPDAFQVQDILKLRLGTLPDKVTGYVTVGISADSPQEALLILRTVITTTDNLIRQDVKSRSKSRIVYLNKALERITRQDQRDAVISVLSSQEKTMMMASADRLYAIDMIDPPSSNPIPTSPKPTPTVVSTIITWTSVVLIGAVLRGHFQVRRSRKKKRDPSLDAAIYGWLRRGYGRLTGKHVRTASSN